jgi:transposase
MWEKPGRHLPGKGLALAAPKKYSSELRESAVALYLETTPRPPISRLAGQIGVHPEALRNWIRKAQTARESGDDPVATPEVDELIRLRKEVADLRRANEILKAANAFLAQQVDATNLRA